MRMSAVIIVVTSTLLCVVAGCESASREEIPGVYVMKRTFGVELLRLEATGLYTQVILLSGDTTAVANTGRWVVSLDDMFVRLEGGLCLDDGFGELNPEYLKRVDGFLGAGFVKKEAGTMWLKLDENDPDYKYRKL